MACPFFYPTEPLDQSWWAHPRRLPLGAAFAGVCRAQPGEEFRPVEFSQLNCCNLGYARSECPRFPADGAADAARFAIGADGGGLVVVRYAVEKDHRPLEHGVFEFDRRAGRFRAAPKDITLARQARVYVEGYLARHDARG